MTNEEIKELLRIFNDSGVGELEIQRGGDRLRIRRHVHEPAVAPLPPAVPPTIHVPAEPQAPPVAPPAPPEPASAAPEGVIVKSPIVGTFYESASPDAPPFVKVGDAVEPGQVLCIIESMKLMNEIEAEVAGVVTARMVQNGQAVEYGAALFSIRPK